MLALGYLCFMIYVGYSTLDIPDNIISNENRVSRETKPIISQSEECETIKTVIFNSKASGKIVTCQGRLLEVGEKTKIIYRNK